MAGRANRRPFGLRHLALGLFALICLSCLGWPGYAQLGDRIEPFVLGLPFSLVWNIGWITLSFMALLLFHLADGKRN